MAVTPVDDAATEPHVVARARTPRLAYAFAAVAIGALALGFGSRDVPAEIIAAEISVQTRPSMHGTNRAYEPALAQPEAPKWIKVDDRIPKDTKGRPLDEVYPSIVQWVHPVTSARELLPWNPARHFGAERTAIHRSDCGSGHCGVDLDGPRGRAIVAVAEGVIVRVDHRANNDGMTGRWVRIQHDDGYLTSYMHLDTVEPTLEVGDRVARGQALGTLGSTGVSANAPHLHFSLELPLRAGYKGDLGFSAARFINPAPFVMRAKVIDVPERRPLKPAF
jgi:murein DD-endopeptidase MepM/ murein hydrolase activator NlpD